MTLTLTTLSKFVPEVVSLGSDTKRKTIQIGEILKDVMTVAVYFSASWCGPCKQFTPILKQYYAQVNEKHKELEIIFVSFDKDEEQWKTYSQEMPWVGIPFGNEHGKIIKKELKVTAIPQIYFISNQGIIPLQGVSWVYQQMK